MTDDDRDPAGSLGSATAWMSRSVLMMMRHEMFDDAKEFQNWLESLPQQLDDARAATVRIAAASRRMEDE